MFQIQDEKRVELKIFSESQSLYDLGVKNQKFKKPMLTFSIFLLLFNLAEIKITGTSIGLISGKINYPAVIPNAIFILTFYYTFLYVAFMQFLKEDLYTEMTDRTHKRRYIKELCYELIETHIANHLKTKHVQIVRAAPATTVDPSLSKAKFTLFINGNLEGNQSKENLLRYIRDIGYATNIIENPKSTIPAKKGNSRVTFEWDFKPSQADLDYFDKHYRKIKFFNLTNLAEFRLPVWLSIFSMFFHILK
ncbi:hypothetical protein [Pseudoalteromonas sp. SR43-3]|uniref:hypothetical protein n=1 Tax=Pseudoalteromonas sp. SR43-3 TaxID=2760943 RepID=UPI001601929A|nr:hypothetical protein [Pseudoalteromonas sp. SR43-3]MBB1275138.1 hypothetical protein [Pseudoalteromonas sp. SR43-3]